MDDNNLDKVTPLEFTWDETNTTVGVIAQEIDTITIGAGLSIGTFSNNWASGSSISFANYDTLNAGSTEYGKTTIKTARHTIDLDELADMMETLKKRLLIIAPNFEKHEKYPMLKAAYDEYKAMETLLSGPDSNE